MPAMTVVIVVVIPSYLLLNLFFLLGLNIFFWVKKVPSRQNAGSDKDKRKLTSHSSHNGTSLRGAGTARVSSICTSNYTTMPVQIG